MNRKNTDCTHGTMLTYGLGECANSLVMNGVFAFAMLFYTKSLGLDPALAGLAMSLSVFWEAATEPVMGHISDNTRCRWGRRHPYMLAGGLLMAACSYLIWTVPAFCRGGQTGVFWYLVTMNLLLRTGLTMFFIPYMALGFEICTSYEGRSRLQGIRQIFNMAANFAGPAMAWVFFFGGKDSVQATAVEANYRHMGAAFALATAAFVVLVCVLTPGWRGLPDAPAPGRRGAWVMEFFGEMKTILADRNPRWVFVFIFVVCGGMVIVSSLQMFVYDDFMKFLPWQKSVAHGSTMVGMALGALASMGLAKRLDKKGTVLLGGVTSIGGNLMLAVLFLTGAVAPHASAGGGASMPALVLFVLFHALYWFGNGVMLPVATAMMGDVAEMRRLATGEMRDGAYSSVFSLSMRMAISLSLIAAGWCLESIGYQVPKDGRVVIQTQDAVWNLGMVTFVVGAGICFLSLLAIRRHPVTRERLEQLRADAGVSIAG